jgi:hypothetical protein
MPTDLLDLLGPPGWCSGCCVSGGTAPQDGQVAKVGADIAVVK